MNDMKGILKETLNDFQPVPPRDIWPDLEAQLAKKSPKKKMGLYFSVAAAIILLLGISFSLLNNTRNRTLIPSAQNSIAQRDTAFHILSHKPSASDSAMLQPKVNAESLDDQLSDKHNEQVDQPHREPILNHTYAKLESESVDQVPVPSVDEVDSTSFMRTLEPITHTHKEPLISKVIEPQIELVDRKLIAVETHNESRPNISPVGQHKSFKLTIDRAIFLASEELDKIVKNSPLEASEEELEDQEGSMMTIKFRVGNFKITRKKFVQTNS